MTLATLQNCDLRHRIEQRTGIDIGTEDAAALRRAEKTLHRWDELECGNGNDYASWCIERDETTGKPYMYTSPHTGEPRREPIPDREAGALRRVAAVCKRHGLYFYHQGDPRGCALYVSDKPINGGNYTNGTACCAD